MNCRKCGEVVCSACSKEFAVKNAKFRETVKLRMCQHCSQLITTIPKPQSPMMFKQSRTSTTTSLFGYYEDDQRAASLTQVPGGAPEQKQRRGSVQAGHNFGRGSPSSQLRESAHSAPTLDRPHVATDATAAAAPQSVPRDYKYNRQSEHVHRQSNGAAPRTKSPSREGAAHGRSQSPGSRHKQSQGYTSGAHQHQQQKKRQRNLYLKPQESFEFGMVVHPPPVAYPDSLRGSESKRRDSESSESSTTRSVETDPEESRKSAICLQQQDTHDDVDDGERSQANCRLSARVLPPPSLYSDDTDGQSDRHTRFSRPRSPPSYCSDEVEVDGRTQLNNSLAAVPPPYTAHPYYSGDIDGRGGSSVGTTTSRTARRDQSALKTKVFTHPSLVSLRDDEEETKAEEFSGTPALPPPTPPAHLATLKMLCRDSSEESTLFDHYNSEKDNTREQMTTTETPIGDRESGHAYDLRDSELGLNLSMCDTSFFLDSDMRQFHDQSWCMENGRPSFENAEAKKSKSTIQRAASRDGSEHSSESLLSDERSAPDTPKRAPVDSAFTDGKGGNATKAGQSTPLF